VQNVWIESYDPTIEDSYRKVLDVDVSASAPSLEVSTDPRQGRHVILEILDTAGTEQFSKRLLPYTQQPPLTRCSCYEVHFSSAQATVMTDAVQGAVHEDRPGLPPCLQHNVSIVFLGARGTAGADTANKGRQQRSHGPDRQQV
jgi:hypothetical protein